MDDVLECSGNLLLQQRLYLASFTFFSSLKHMLNKPMHMDQEVKEDKRNEFWSGLADCVDGLSRRNYVVVLGDLNARGRNVGIQGVLKSYRVGK